MDYKSEINERQKINRLLVQELSTLVETYPTQRFGQILMNYFFSKYDSLEGVHLKSTIYNEEPARTLANLSEVKRGSE